MKLQNPIKQKENSKGNGTVRSSCSVSKEIFAVLCLLISLAVFCGAASVVVTPKRQDCGALWRQYRQEERDSIQVLAFGSSMAYCDLAPAVIYEETGLASYVMAGPDQTMPMTAHYVRQALKTQTPQVVLVEASGLLTATHNRSVKTNITYLPWGRERISAIFEEELTAEERIGLLFPLYAFHSRWDALTKEDITPAEPDMMAGYTPLFGASPPQKGEVLAPDESAYAQNLQAAQELVSFCQERDIAVIFFLSPVKSPISDAQTAQLQADLTSLGADFWNFQTVLDELSIDMEDDFYDKRHLNLTGAEKFSRYLAQRLQSLPVRWEGESNTELWQARTAAFDALKKEGAE